MPTIPIHQYGTQHRPDGTQYKLCPFQATLVIVRLLLAPCSCSNIGAGIDLGGCYQLIPRARGDLIDQHSGPATGGDHLTAPERNWGWLSSRHQCRRSHEFTFREDADVVCETGERIDEVVELVVYR